MAQQSSCTLIRTIGLLSVTTIFAAASIANNLPRFAFTDTAGHTHSSAEWAAKQAVVFFFVTTDCPLSNLYVPEMNRIAQKYAPRGVAFYAVQGDSTIAADVVKRHAKEFGFGFPYLFDPQESLAAFTGADTTPEVAVVTSRGGVRYLGRIDNLVEDFGKQRLRATEFDLRDALDAVLGGNAVARPRTPAIGCAITKLN
ncbi:MAG: redoxin domain-containing protein [Bryobacteraceae bacterium]